MGYRINYNGTNNTDIGIFATRPDVPASKRKYESYKIAGRDGELYEYEDSVDDIQIPVKMGFHGPANLWNEKFRAAKRWLAPQSGKLVFGDDPNYHYRVKRVYIDGSERTAKTIGEFKAVFICEGYMYRNDGMDLIELDSNMMLDNLYTLSKPEWNITGRGTLHLTVNGKELIAVVNGTLTIDTDKMVAYNEYGTNQNNVITGDYEDLWLREGENNITFTSGYDVKIRPNWRCL